VVKSGRWKQALRPRRCGNVAGSGLNWSGNSSSSNGPQGYPLPLALALASATPMAAPSSHSFHNLRRRAFALYSTRATAFSDPPGFTSTAH